VQLRALLHHHEQQREQNGGERAEAKRHLNESGKRLLTDGL